MQTVTGESVMLKCASVPSVPAVRYDWKVDDEYVMLDDRRYLDHLGNGVGGGVGCERMKW